LVSLQVGVFRSFETNSAGCVEIAGELDCARKLQAAQACARDVCLKNCEPATSDEYQAYSDCQDDARDDACAEYEAETQCLGEDAATLCIGSDTFVTFGKAACANGG
jgi:hypothetical protein